MAISAKMSVFTVDDWKLAKDIRPGDWVFNRLGKPVKVKTAQIFRSEDCYRVMFDDYLSVDGDMHLAFQSEDPMYRTRTFEYKGVRPRSTKLKLRSVPDMCEVGLYHRGHRMRYSVPTTEPLQLPTQPLDIPPFLYGFWYTARSVRPYLMVPNEFADKTFEHFKNSGYQIQKLGSYKGKYEKFRTTPSIKDQLVGKPTRNIPLSYLNGSTEQRLELIQGILSAKPCRKVSRDGIFIYKSNKKHLITTFQYLSESLGAKTRFTIDKVNKSYILNVARLTPFLEQMAPKRPVVHLARRYVKSITPLPAQLCVHIETDDEDGSFLAGEGFIPCH